MKKQKNQLLLIEDVDGLGRSGDVVTAKPGFIRNFLLPKKMAVVADNHTIKMREKLQEERSKRAVVDRNEAEAIAKKISEKLFEIEVKVDPDGHMYGSVTSTDLVELLEKEGIVVEKKNFLMGLAIKTLGEHVVKMRLKEETLAELTLIVNSDIDFVKPAVVVKPAPVEEASPAESSEE